MDDNSCHKDAMSYFEISHSTNIRLGSERTMIIFQGIESKERTSQQITVGVKVMLKVNPHKPSISSNMIASIERTLVMRDGCLLGGTTKCLNKMVSIRRFF